MNLVECYVTKILGYPYFSSGFWWQKLKYKSNGFFGETVLREKDKYCFTTLTVGFKFLS